MTDAFEVMMNALDRTEAALAPKETYTHKVARMNAERKFNAKHKANGGIMQDCWSFLTPKMQQFFIDREIEQMIADEDEAAEEFDNGQFGVGA